MTFRLAGALLLTGLLLSATCAHATSSFAYRWKEGLVTVRWREGSRSGRESAVRSLVGHWKRLAVSAWAGSTLPLTLDVTLNGTGMGSGAPRLRLSAGAEGLTLAGDHSDAVGAPLADTRILRAIAELRRAAGAGASRSADGLPRLTDDYRPRMSPDGKWVAFRSWRAGQGEVWLASSDGRLALRCGLPVATGASLPVSGSPPIGEGPLWTPDGRLVCWIQGRSLCVVDLLERTGQLLRTGPMAAVAISPSPWPGHALVELEDGQMLLMDLKGRRAVPIQSLLPELISLGSYDWSPTGRRLLFRARGGVSQANLRPSSPIFDWFQRVARAARGQPPVKVPPPGEAWARAMAPYHEEFERYQEQIAVLDLAGGRLVAVPLDSENDSPVDLTGAVWSPDEQQIYVSTRRVNGSSALWRLSLQPTVLTSLPSRRDDPDSKGPLLPIGWLEKGNSSSRPLVIDEERLRTLTPDGSRLEDAGRVSWRCLTPGPDGGYLGVDEEDEATEDEAGLWLAWQRAVPSGELPGRRRLPEGLFVRREPDDSVSESLEQILSRGNAVDLDLDDRASSAVVAVSRGGEVCELLSVSPEGEIRSLSRALDRASVSLIPLRSAGVTVMGTRSGLAALTADLRGEPRSRWVWVVVLTIGLGGLLLLGRHRRRKEG